MERGSREVLPYHTTPTEGNELGDLSNFKLSSEERIIMADWLRARREGSQAQRTQLAPFCILGPL